MMNRMNVTFSCPRCEGAVRLEVAVGDAALVCPHCQARMPIPPGAMAEGSLRRCLVCPSHDLFARKDFPQRLGVAIVVVGFAASCVAWYYYEYIWTYAILFATALVDALLYLYCGEALQCYRCGAMYRGVTEPGEYPSFSLEVHERHRQQAARENKATAAKSSGFRVQGSDAHFLNPEP
jgi:hypothetical protein